MAGEKFDKSQITVVSVKSNVHVGNMQHLHVEASAAVRLEQDPSEVVDGLKQFVADELMRAKTGHVMQDAPHGRFPRDYQRRNLGTFGGALVKDSGLNDIEHE